MKNVSTGKLVWGLILIALGVGFFLDSTGIIEFGQLIRMYWPGILVLIGLVDLSTGKYRNAAFWLILGGVLLLSTLEIFAFDIWSVVWPFILVWIGLNILFSSEKKRKANVVDSADDISSTAVFAEDEKKSSAKSLKTANMSAILGSSRVDLSDVKLDKDIELEVTIVFGGGELIVPKNAKIQSDALAVVGGIDDKRKNLETVGNAPVIKIRGTIIFGGLEIKD